MIKLSLASDHAGYEVKEELKKYLISKGFHIEDMGTFSSESCDYPDYIKEAAKKVALGECDFGIGVCGSGVGVSIAANKIKGIRAALAYNEEIAKLSRRHNNANFLALGARFLSVEDAKKIVDGRLSTEFERGRHQRRVEKIKQIENLGE